MFLTHIQFRPFSSLPAFPLPVLPHRGTTPGHPVAGALSAWSQGGAGWPEPVKSGASGSDTWSCIPAALVLTGHCSLRKAPPLRLQHSAPCEGQAPGLRGGMHGGELEAPCGRAREAPALSQREQLGLAAAPSSGPEWRDKLSDSLNSRNVYLHVCLWLWSVMIAAAA